MAVTHDFTCWLDSEMGVILFAPTSKTVERGDTIRITHHASNGPAGTITISGFTSNRYTSTSNMSLSRGSTQSRTLRSDAVLGNHTLSATSSGYSGSSVTITVDDGTDDTPDSFSFTNVNLATPDDLIYSNTIQVSGINVGITASISGTGGTFAINGGSFSSANRTVHNGDSIQLRVQAAPSWNTTRTATLNLNGVTGSFSVTTRNDPGAGELIFFPGSANNYSFRDVAEFFAGNDTIGPATMPTQMSAYRRGFDYVPNITQNNSISTSVSGLALTQFVGSATYLNFESYGGARYAGADTTTGSKTEHIFWQLTVSHPANPVIGYGLIIGGCEIRWALTEYTNGYNTGVTMSASESYARNAYVCQLTASAPANTERTYGGYVTVWIRSVVDPSKVITTQLQYNFFFKGP